MKHRRKEGKKDKRNEGKTDEIEAENKRNYYEVVKSIRTGKYLQWKAKEKR